MKSLKSEHKLIESYREASYTLTTYLESKEPGLEFDPPSPFCSRQQRSKPLSTLSSKPGDSNLNRNENARPNSSEPTPCPDLDAEDARNPLAILELGSGMGIIVAKLVQLINRGANGDSTGKLKVPRSPSLIKFEEQPGPWYR